VARWTGTWLSGLEAAGVERRAQGSWRGQRLGRPEAGPGSVAGFAPRLGAVLIDILVAGLIGGLVNVFVRDPSFWTRQGAGVGALVLMYGLLLPTAGQTIGMWVARIGVARLAGGPLSVPAALLRGALVALTLPGLFTDRDGRGLHDRAVGSIVLRA
jgi:uncharacterized RDD family membrane protein YckC